MSELSFRLTEEQWAAVGAHISRLGGEPTAWLKERLESVTAQSFLAREQEAQEEQLLRTAARTAQELVDTLQQLSCVSDQRAASSDGLLRELFRADATARLSCAKRIRNWVERAGIPSSPARKDDERSPGRPADRALKAWAWSLLKLADECGWQVCDDRGRTSAVFVDVMIELAGCARSVGIDHNRDVRRAVTRAIATVREERAEAQAKEAHELSEIKQTLDAVARPAQKTPPC